MALCPTADDIWFWGMAVLKGTAIRCLKNPQNKIIYVNLDKELKHECTLGDVNVLQGGNDRQFCALLECYPQLGKKLKDSSPADMLQ